MADIGRFFKTNFRLIIIAICILILVIIGIFALIINNKTDEIDVYRDLKYNYFTMYSAENKVGVINSNGELIIEPIYLDIYIPNPEKDVFFCFSTETEYTILNLKGEELFKEYDEVTALQTSEDSLDFEKYVLRFKKDGKYGLIDFAGSIILEAEYDSIESLKYKPGELLVRQNDKYGIITSSGNLKAKIEYDSIVGDEFYKESEKYGVTGYIVGTKTDTGFLYGYLNSEGDKVLDIEFESINRVLKYNENDSYLIVMNNGKKGVYKNNKEIIEQNYQNIIYAETSDIFVVRRNSNYGIFSTSGNEILGVKYSGYTLAGDYISVELNDGTKELYDVNGNKISNLNYKSIESAGSTGAYIAIDENGYYSIIMSGETLSNNYTYISYAFDNYFIFRDESGLYGLLNIYSGTVIEPQYTQMLVIDGKSAIEGEYEDGTMEVYTSKMDKVISMSNAIVENINENYARIYNYSEIEYINKNGEIVQNIEAYNNRELYAFNENGKWGYKNSNDEIIINSEYDFATELNEYGFAGILKDGKWGVINSEGEIITECIYNLETYYIPSFVGKYRLELASTYYCTEIN